MIYAVGFTTRPETIGRGNGILIDEICGASDGPYNAFYNATAVPTNCSVPEQVERERTAMRVFLTGLIKIIGKGVRVGSQL